jgi:hypothetical protein
LRKSLSSIGIPTDKAAFQLPGAVVRELPPVPPGYAPDPDVTGETVVPPQFEDAEFFYEGLAAVVLSIYPNSFVSGVIP